MQKRFAPRHFDLLYFYLPENEIEFERKMVSSNVLKISFQKEKKFEWQGNPEIFDEVLKDFHLAFKTKFRWYTSPTYLNGLKKKFKMVMLKLVSDLIFIKKYRRAFRDKYLEKRNHFQ